jgi:hypothetical protein
MEHGASKVIELQFCAASCYESVRLRADKVRHRRSMWMECRLQEYAAYIATQAREAYDDLS